MTAQLPSREILQKIIETANEIITVNNGTNEDIWENDTATITRLYDQLNDDLANPSVVKALAEFALAAHEQEPTIHRYRRVSVEPFGPYPWHYGDFVGFSEPVVGIEDEYFYAHPAPVPAVPECFINAVSALEALYRNGQKQCWGERYTTDMAYASGVLNACRAAMLNGGKS